MGGFRKGGFSNDRFVLKPDIAIASEVSILSKNSLAITDFHAMKTQHVQLFENPLPGTPPRFPKHPARTKNTTTVLIYYHRSNSLSVVISCEFSPRNARCLCFATTVVN